MALNTCSKLLKLKEISKLRLLNPKQISVVNKISVISYTTLYRRDRFKNINADIYKNKYYSIEAINHSNSVSQNEHMVTVDGDNVPSPFTDIATCDFPEYIKSYLKDQNILKPTAIQSHAWPIALQGTNFVGIAQTGTGKTLAFLLPAIVHIKEKTSRKGKGPIVLIIAPTRELARQIEEVAKHFQKLLRIRSVCVYGGASRSIQANELQNGVEIVIATPGRLNDFLTSRVTTLSRCTYVVLDEADRMLDMGFEPQIRQILEGVPIERQIMMFSATWPKEIRHLAKDYLGEYVQVNVGSTELSANRNITQCFHFCERHNKLEKFKQIVNDLQNDGIGKLLVFSNTQHQVDFLEKTLKRHGYSALGIHGKRTQLQRDLIINKFKNGRVNILVATDVAARGLDVDGVTHVINYDFPQTAEDYIHRIGRTGRSENKGLSHTLLIPEDGRLANDIISVLKEAKQDVPKGLEELAENYKSLKFEEKQEKYKQRRPKSWVPNRRWDKFGGLKDYHRGRY